MNRWVDLLAWAALFTTANASAATFTYHGSLQDSGRPAEGRYDLELTLYSAASGGSAIGGPLILEAVPVQGGNFSTEVDFGPLPDVTGDAWLAVGVRTADNNEEFTALATRALVSATAATNVCPGAWTLYGNAGTVPGTSTNQNYIGTADVQKLVFGIAGAPVAQFDTNQNFAINSVPIDAATELTLAGSPLNGGGAYANFDMHQYGDLAGIQISVGNATSYANNDAAFYIDQYNSNAAARKRRFVILGNGAFGLNTSTGIDGNPLGYSDLTVAASDASAYGTRIALKTGDNTGAILAAAPSLLGGGPLVEIYYRMSDGVTHTMLEAEVGVGTGLNEATASSNKPFIVGTNSFNGNGAHLTPGGIWTNGSSRTFKEAFRSVDFGRVLDRVVALPVGTWQYKNGAGEGRHLGPVAEDFKAAFGLGNDERYIASSDEEGVALAAIKGLNAKLEKAIAMKDAKIQRLQASLDELSERLAKLEVLEAK